MRIKFICCPFFFTYFLHIALWSERNTHPDFLSRVQLVIPISEILRKNLRRKFKFRMNGRRRFCPKRSRKLNVPLIDYCWSLIFRWLFISGTERELPSGSPMISTLHFSIFPLHNRGIFLSFFRCVCGSFLLPFVYLFHFENSWKIVKFVNFFGIYTISSHASSSLSINQSWRP